MPVGERLGLAAEEVEANGASGHDKKKKFSINGQMLILIKLDC